MFEAILNAIARQPALADGARKALARWASTRPGWLWRFEPAPFNPDWQPFLDSCAQGVVDSSLLDGIERGFHRQACSHEVLWDHELQSPTALHLAICAPSLDALEALLNAGAHPGSLSPQGNCSPMAWASYLGAVGAMELLARHGASIGPCGLSSPRLPSPLERACWGGKPESLDWLQARSKLLRLDWPPKNEWGSALLWAARQSVSLGKKECLRRLLAWGAPVEGDPGQDAPLLWACDGGDLESAMILLRAGADPNTPRPHDGSTPFMWAARHLGRDPRIAQAILDHGGCAQGERRDGRSALMMAADGAMPECVQMCLDAGADFFAFDRPQHESLRSRDALRFAAGSGSLETLRLLLDAGARASPRPGRCSLLVEADHLDLFEELLSRGADPFEGADLSDAQIHALAQGVADEPTHRQASGCGFSHALRLGWGASLALAWDLALKARVERGQGADLAAWAARGCPLAGERLRALELSRIERLALSQTLSPPPSKPGRL